MADNTNRNFGNADDDQKTGTTSTSGRMAQDSGNTDDLTTDTTQSMGRKGGETRLGGRQNQGGLSDTQQGMGNTTGISSDLDTDSDDQNSQNQ